MPNIKFAMLAAAGLATATAMPAVAQGTAGSTVEQWGRMMAEPGTFWLDSMDDTEVIRYTTSRDVSLCLPEPTGVFAAQKGIPLEITWDGEYSATLRPGNCFFFDARTVTVKPGAPLPSGEMLVGRVRTQSGLQRGN